METVVSLPPSILQSFNANLLMSFLERIEKYVIDKIIPKAKKKIRPQDTGKQRAFDKLYKEYQEVYERKKNEEIDYRTARQEKIKKRSNFYASGQTCKFTRMDSTK